MQRNGKGFPTNSPCSSADKRAVREAALSARSRLSSKGHADASAEIRRRVLEHPAVSQARHVFCFVSFGTEVDTHPLIDALLAASCLVAVPRIVGADTMEATAISGWGDLEPGKWGILSPRQANPAPGPFDAAIIPGVAFSESGGRVGHGRGYYDRWLATHQVGACIAIGFECQILDDVPTEPHDYPVDAIITENRTITPGTGTTSG